MKQDSVTFNHKKVVHICIAYEIKALTLAIIWNYKIVLFGAVSLTKNADIDKYKYSGYEIGFNRHGSFWFPGTGLGRKIMIFGVDMNSSTKIDNKKKDILTLGKGPTQRLEHTLTAEKMYSINFTEHNKHFGLSLHYNGANS